MKKTLVLLVSAIFVLGFVGSAFAIHAEIPAETAAVVSKGMTQVTLSGQLRLRARSNNNFDFNDDASDQQNYYHTRLRLGVHAKVSDMAEARWSADGVSGLPWWANAKNEEQIADAVLHPCATTFDGRGLAEERAELELDEFVRRLVSVHDIPLAELSSRRRGTDLTRARIEFAALAVGRYGLRVRDVASRLDKHVNSVTKWLNRGLRLERDDPEFKIRLDQLDAAISVPD